MNKLQSLYIILAIWAIAGIIIYNIPRWTKRTLREEGWRKCGRWVGIKYLMEN